MFMHVAATTLTAFFVFAGITAPVALAHEGHDHKIMGTVTMAASDHLMLKDREGNEITVRVTEETKVRSKPARRVEEIEAGTRVVVTARMEKDKTWTARLIEVGVAPSDKR